MKINKNMIVYENSKLFNRDVIITNKYYKYYKNVQNQIREKYKNDKKMYEQYLRFAFLQNQFMQNNFNEKCIFLMFDNEIVVVFEIKNNNVIHKYEFFVFCDALCLIDENEYKTQNEMFEKYIKNENVEKIIKKCIANYNKI